MTSNMHDEKQPAFMRRQFEFAAHIRNPALNKKPEGIENRRMGIYRDLFYNNVEGFIASGFPVLREIFSDESWHSMVRDFYTRHRCKTPYFLEISQEFLDYLGNERDNPNDPAFINELAHYEWTELAMSAAEEEISDEGIDTRGDLIQGTPILSPLAWLLTYQFDVQHIGPDYQPEVPPQQATTLVVYRNRDDEVGFMEVNPVTAHLVQSLELNPGQTGMEILNKIAEELNHSDPGAVIKGGMQIMNQLREADILLGVRN
ncbi:MAG TPA: DUF2063 domain-containing protein [Gammaproteobacteria bacterium]|nr:DUF2063 domain-containing protein [Gammaproteobacteria bacterium]